MKKIARTGQTERRCAKGCGNWPRSGDGGYPRLGWLAARKGHVINRKKLYRIYRNERLMVRRRGRRKQAIGTRAPLALPDAINRRWSLDFVCDALDDGRRFRILCVVDDFSRECLDCVVDTSIGGCGWYTNSRA